METSLQLRIFCERLARELQLDLDRLMRAWNTCTTSVYADSVPCPDVDMVDASPPRPPPAKHYCQSPPPLPPTPPLARKLF